MSLILPLGSSIVHFPPVLCIFGIFEQLLFFFSNSTYFYQYSDSVITYNIDYSWLVKENKNDKWNIFLFSFF